MGKDNEELIGQSSGHYEIMGVDWKAKTLYIPNWGWGLGAAYLAYRLLFKKRR